MTVSTLVQDIKQMKGLEGVNVERIEFYTQSLFPIELWDVTIGNSKFSLVVKNINILEMAVQEVKGLDELRNRGANVPKVYGILQRNDMYQIVMEFCPPNFTGDKNLALKETLLSLYQRDRQSPIENNDWGWDVDNFIGTLNQFNNRYKSFHKYWIESRINPLIHEIERRGMTDEIWKINLIRKVENAIQYWNLDSIQPRLIHGDLWGGNVIYSGTKAYLIDPSISYGNPEQDLAMLSLFDSALNDQSKEEILQKIGQNEKWKERECFWLIYPLLVHVAMFGKSYLVRLNAMINSLP